MLGLCCCAWACLVGASRQYSLVAVCRLLTAVATLVAQALEHRLSTCVAEEPKLLHFVKRKTPFCKVLGKEPLEIP